MEVKWVDVRLWWALLNVPRCSIRLTELKLKNQSDYQESACLALFRATPNFKASAGTWSRNPSPLEGGCAMNLETLWRAVVTWKGEWNWKKANLHNSGKVLTVCLKWWKWLWKIESRHYRGHGLSIQHPFFGRTSFLSCYMMTLRVTQPHLLDSDRGGSDLLSLPTVIGHRDGHVAQAEPIRVLPWYFTCLRLRNRKLCKLRNVTVQFSCQDGKSHSENKQHRGRRAGRFQSPKTIVWKPRSIPEFYIT